jgi:5-methylcytosine-specific restriction endonuclease McrA
MESWWRNRDKRTAENKAWREANQDRVRASIRRWREENRERSNLLSRLKKQRKRAAGRLTAADWELVIATYGGACLSCAKPEVTIDHIVPVSAGGRNEIDNVQPLCGFCNGSKGVKTIDFRPAPIAELLAEAERLEP